MTELKPAAFMSYVHADDKYGHLTTLRERLSDDICVQTGQEFPIFQDRKDILWGQNWQARIEESLDAATFLIPIITPAFSTARPAARSCNAFWSARNAWAAMTSSCPSTMGTARSSTTTRCGRRTELAGAIAARQYADSDWFSETRQSLRGG